MRNDGMSVTCLFCCCVFFLGGFVQSANCCVVGLYGDTCRFPCPAKCLDGCRRNDGYCTNCVVGYYGGTCSYRCPEQCTDGCGRTNGICIGCDVGYYGDTCRFPCPAKCLNGCRRNDGYCTNCTTGLYGDQCDNRCSGQCVGGCERNGYCTSCQEGRYGFYCDQACIQTCENPLSNVRSCDRSSGHCVFGGHTENPVQEKTTIIDQAAANECREGLYGPYCNKWCSNQCRNGCNKTTGDCISCDVNYVPPNCTECVRGMYGSACNVLCSHRCRNGCNKISGDCNSCDVNFANPQCTGCTQGFYGTSCNMECQGTCDTRGCDQSSGMCFACARNFAPPECKRCTQGFYGTSCNMECQGICDTRGCYQSSGMCFACARNFAPPECKRCTQGFYGTSCNMECQGTCDTRGCDQSSGMCFACARNFAPRECKRCTQGFYGTSCNMECQGICDTRGCDQSSGMCFACARNFSPPECKSCNTGYYGDRCSSQCYRVCRDGCTSPNGFCMHCPEGRYGNWCERKCSSNCNSFIPGTKHCDRSTGFCSLGCIEGWYGNFCNVTCSGSCSAGCNQTTGKCTSCNGYFTMPECTECIQGFYGVNCTEVCGQCINDETCSPVNGLCANGCKEGFGGNYCQNVSVPIASDTQSATAAAIVGGVVAALAVIIAVFIIVIMYRRRRRQMKNEPTEEKFGNSEPFYNNILTQEMHPGSDSTSLHVYGNISSSSSHGLQPRKMPRKNISVTNDTYSHSADKCNAGVDIHKYENVGAVANAGQSLVLNASQDVRVSSAGAKNIKTDAEDDVFEESYDDIYNSEDIYSAYKPDNPSPQLDALQRSLLASLSSGGLSTQFELLPKGMISSHKEGTKPANIKKNRFKALCAYDHSRVILHRPAGDPDTDYINANYIKDYKKDKAYIAAQGPRSSTVNDMWWMIWQEGITQIVMLTNLTEDGKNKCDEYWPKAGKPGTYGHVEITNVDEEQRADFIKRSFSIKEKGTTDKRQLEQYHYVAWPDHGIPPATSLVNFWRYIKARANPNAPPLVHCSAGVGRTGTYIALDIAMDIAIDKGNVDVHNIVNNLRKDRCFMVQAEAQYKFLHEVILEAYTSHKTRLTFKRFQELFPEGINIHKNNKIIDNEYKMLQQMGEFHPKSIHDVSSSKENMKKNRNANVLPDDNHLAYLAAEGSGGNTYINATYLSSFKQRKGVILTQLPLPDTLQDFWRLVDGMEINTIVSLGSNNDVTSIKNFCQYWPKTVNESLTIGPYVINLMASASIGTNLTSYNLSIWTEKKTWEMRLLHYTNWAGEVPDNTGEIIHLVDTLSTSRVQTDTCPLLFQCIDGASRSGLFSLSCDIVNRAVCDREIDIFQSARQVQSVRPQAVTKEAQYRYCYKLAQDYQRHMEVYQNT